MGFVGSFCVDCVGLSGGLLLLWSDRWDVEIKSYSFGHIDAVIRDADGNCWRFSGIYGEPKIHNRFHTWELLKRLKPQFDLPWLCGGDFNETIRLGERKGGRFRPISASINFQSTLEECELSDFQFTGHKFTWNNKREGTGNIQARLDRFLSNFRWKNIFPNAITAHLPFEKSDHRPILIRLGGNQNMGVFSKGIKPFRFEPFWIREEEYLSVVKRACYRLERKIAPKKRELEVLYSSPNSEFLMKEIKILEKDIDCYYILSEYAAGD
ncbi:hypothetical protein DH2020_031714 [Rehmannia glutinosa]|uniref:Endonuclease/exonuclease/phosphatase domain-containing protein n=1 Tax=Rehmannia glutinosa TaxID=99300 RepID=A0ABR0VHA2_REHGL